MAIKSGNLRHYYFITYYNILSISTIIYSLVSKLGGLSVLNTVFTNDFFLDVIVNVKLGQ